MTIAVNCYDNFTSDRQGQGYSMSVSLEAHRCAQQHDAIDRAVKAFGPAYSSKVTHLLVRTIWFVLLVGCGGPAENVTPPATPPLPPLISTISVTPDAATIAVGESLQLAAQARDVSGVALAGRLLTWSSDNATVATVSASGLVTAISAGGPINVMVTGEGRIGNARVTVVLPARDSVVAKTGVETVLRVSGVEIRFAAGALPAGTTVEMQPVTGRLGTVGALLGSPYSVSLRFPASAVAALSAAGEANFIPFSLTLSGTSSLSAADGRYRLLGFAQGLPSMPVGATIPMVPTSVIATPGVPGSLSASFALGITAKSTPVLMSTQLVVLTAGCSQSELPDSRRFRSVREASPSGMGKESIVLVLVHGWQPNELTCSDAADYDYLTNSTWKEFVVSLSPNYGAGYEPRAQQFDVWSYQYLTTSLFAGVGEDLKRLLNAKLPGRKIVLLAHSKGGLVSAASMLAPSAPNVVGLITAGTPWNGTPMGGPAGIVGHIALYGCYLVSPTNIVLELMDYGVCAPLADWYASARDLGTATDGEIAERITKRRSELTGRVTAIGSSLTAYPRYQGFGNAVFYGGLWDVISIFSGENDGLVPLSSSLPTIPGPLAGFSKNLTPLRGFDHSGYFSVTPPGVTVTGQSQIHSELDSLLDRFAPLNALTVIPATLSLTIGETRQLAAIPKDVTGRELPGRIVRWSPSDPSVADVSSTGLVTGKSGSAQPVTITAQVEGKSASAQVTVAIPSTGEWRAILTWGGAPNDLDSHLTGPTATGGRFWINYANIGNCTAAPFACLDEDISNAGGPETTRITQTFAGKYSYSVHNYSGGNSATSTTLSQSNARVALYRGSTLTQVFSVPSTPGTLWTVFEIDDGVMRPVNTMSGVAPTASMDTASAMQVLSFRLKPPPSR